MNQTPLEEDAWWSGLEGDEVVNNTAGNPPYDVEAVADRILAAHLYPHRFLDMGCGVGRLTNHIAREVEPNRIVHGFDIALPLLKTAATGAPSNAKFWHGDGRSIPAGIPGSFDLIWSVTMFQHIPHDAKWSYITQASKRLTKGGLLAFTVAVGDEPPSFLNHQMTERELEDMGMAMLDLFDTVSHDHDPDTGWTWIEARRLL